VGSGLPLSPVTAENGTRADYLNTDLRRIGESANGVQRVASTIRRLHALRGDVPARHPGAEPGVLLACLLPSATGAAVTGDAISATTTWPGSRNSPAPPAV